jgi:NAD(P)-dependent dehydrogenase (short-subunit alcohol dehydrogenase family)
MAKERIMDLSTKTVLLTGASKGIGAAIARTLCAAGAYVIAHYGSDRAGAEEATVGAAAGRCLLVGADLADMAQVDRLWSEAAAWRGNVDALVNNAAVMPMKGGVEDEDADWDAAWDSAMVVNVAAPMRLMRHAARHYLEREGGTIVTLSSWAAQRGSGNPGMLAYSASKGAVMAATKTMARNYAHRGLLCYVVAPGVVHTRMSEIAAESMGGAQAMTAGLAMREWVPPSDIGELVAFLVSGACRHLSGATLDVNGSSYIR